MLTVLVEYDGRKLGRNTLLIPFKDTWLALNTCRDMLQLVLSSHLELPDLLYAAEQIKMFCAKQQEFVQLRSCSETKIDNATACLDLKTISVIESFSTQSFHFKVVSPAPSTEPTASSSAQVNPFNIMMNARSNFAFSPPLLSYKRMYANHHLLGLTN